METIKDHTLNSRECGRMSKKYDPDKRRFKKDPFFLYPLTADMIDSHFVNREQEIKNVNGLLRTRFDDSIVICAVIGGIGIGKSSLLNYIGKLAGQEGISVEHIEGSQIFQPDIESSTQGPVAYLIDGLDKAEDQKALDFYSRLGCAPAKGNLVFFTDTYDRGPQALHLRSHTISHNIALPQRLDKVHLRFFLEERMRRCLSEGARYEFPFEDDALDMAAVRSRGNLRTFLNYAKHAWTVSMGEERDRVTAADVISGMISVDSPLLGGCDIIDMRILWFSSSGEMNKAFLAHQCGINVKTLQGRIDSHLREFIDEDRIGKEVVLTSIYKRFPVGVDLLSQMIRDLGFQMSEVTGTTEIG
jgi:hypothetical protein